MIKQLIVATALLSAISSTAQKSFEKKTNVIGFGADLGIYNYQSRIGSTNSTSSSAAANKMLSLLYERGVTNWLGLGAKVQLCDYFTEKDSVTGTKPSVKAIDATLLVNAHFVKTKHVDLLTGFNIGYSNLNWEARDASISQAQGGGLVFDLHLQPRFYFGDHVGMFLNLAYTHYSYKNMDFTNIYTQQSDVLDLVGGGVNFGIGLQAKF
jgi:hypothetical protein